MAVRTRFAPSPTGPMTVGNVRTALFNYLFTRKEGGVFILRIEDTDRERSKPEWEKNIMENLEWLGIKWDEFYRQSERTELYASYLQKLLDEEKAYYCFCTAEELEAQRQDQLSRGVAPRYAGTCTTLKKEQQQEKLRSGIPAVIRFVVPSKILSFEDMVRGQVKFDTGLIGDIVIAKDLQTPLYNFSVVVDDFEMKVTHVIRGEDHISNTPKQIVLQETFGFPRPAYAHLPLILGEDRTKLSKRHGDNSVTRFRREGYLPEAMVNFLALLGWNPGDEREIFSMAALLKEFSLKKIQKGGAVFNIRRLDWLNGFMIRQTVLPKLTQLCIPYFLASGFLEQKEGVLFIKGTEEQITKEKMEQIVELYHQRLKKLSEITEFTDFFFQTKLAYEKDLLRWKDAKDKDVAQALTLLEASLSHVPEEQWTKEHLQELLLKEAEQRGDRGYLLWPLRAALTGKQASAGPFEIAEVLGKAKTLQRIKEARALLDGEQSLGLS